MARLTFFLLILAVLVILGLSNLSPTIALTFLGIRTLELPLGVWLLGAIGAGAFTTLVLTLLFNLSHSSSRYRASRANSRRVAGGDSRPWDAWFHSSPSPAGKPSGFVASASGASRNDRLEDDWETSNPRQEDWEDWDMVQESSRSQQSSSFPPRNASWHDSPDQTPTEIRDREDEDWANWEGYIDKPDERRNPTNTDRSSSEGRDLQDRSPHQTTPPRRTEFESPQAPETSRQDGSVYSYRYRPSRESPSPRPEAARYPNDRTSEPFAENKFGEEEVQGDLQGDMQEDFPDNRQSPRRASASPEEVYDADYRVIVPPYRPDPETAFNPSDEAAVDASDVYPDDLPLESGEEPPSIEALYGLDDEDDDEDETEIWDEDWGLEDEPKNST